MGGACKFYAIYDTKYYDQCIYFGTLQECADFLNQKSDSLRSYLSRKKNNSELLIKHRYELFDVGKIRRTKDDSM